MNHRRPTPADVVASLSAVKLLIKGMNGAMPTLAAEMRRDLRRSREALEQLGGCGVPFVSYPYGGVSAVGSREARAAGGLGHRIGFTMERALNVSLDEPLLLARIDTNDAPGGKRPLMQVVGGAVECAQGLAPASRVGGKLE